MQKLETAKNRRAASVVPPVICTQHKDVESVRALPNYCLNVRFHDGVEGTVDLSRRVRSQNAGVFAALADPNLFAQVGIEWGAVWWPGDIDLAPDAMHDEIARNGEWVL